MPTIRITVIINLDVIHVKLRCRNLSVKVYGVSIRTITSFVNCIERIFTFSRIRSPRCVAYISTRIRTFYINRRQTELVIRYKTNTVCIACCTISNYRTASINRTRRFRVIQRNIYSCRNVTRLIY